MDRREILKLFGITAAVATTGIAAAEVATAKVPRIAPGMIPGPPDLRPPDGIVYQWKRVFISKDEPDLTNIMEMVGTGWKPVPMSRHGDQLRAGTADSNQNVLSYWIEYGGLVLMEKPADQIPKPRKHPLPWEEQDAAD